MDSMSLHLEQTVDKVLAALQAVLMIQQTAATVPTTATPIQEYNRPQGGDFIDIHVYLHMIQDPAEASKLDTILSALTTIQTQEKKDMAVLDDKLTSLTAQVAANTTVIGSAEVLINGIADQIKAGVDAALAAGATPVQLQAITALQTTIQQNDDELTKAIVANTPNPAPPVPAQALRA
jgi:hypothetical protein